MRRVCAIVDDLYHPGDDVKAGLDAALSGDRWEVEYCHGPEFSRSDLDAADVLCVARIGKIDPKRSDEYWMTPALEEAIDSYVRGGGAILALHAGTASFPKDGPYRRLCAGHFVSHPEGHPKITVSPRDVDHPVLGTPDPEVHEFTINDEHYFVEVDEARTCILLDASSPHGSTPAGWAHEHGEGRVCVLTPGHTEAVFLHPQMVKLVANACGWLLGRSRNPPEPS